jgi:hypothetical protein
MMEKLTVNGTDLSLYCYPVAHYSGLLTTPPRKSGNLAVAGRHGSLQSPRKRFDEGTVVLPLTVAGATQQGTVPAGSTEQQEFYERTDELLMLFFGSDIVTLDHTLPDGSVRRAECEVQDVLDFTRLPLGQAARVSVALTIPGAFWSDISTVTAGPTLMQTAGSMSLAAFAGATAPMDDLLITFGPGSNPTLRQTITDAFLAYDGVIAAGRKLVVNTGTWDVTGTIDAGGTWIPPVTSVRFGPEAKFFYLTPPLKGTAPVLSLSHTGGGSMSVTVTGKRRFLTG